MKKYLMLVSCVQVGARQASTMDIGAIDDSESSMSHSAVNIEPYLPYILVLFHPFNKTLCLGPYGLCSCFH